MSSGGEGGTRTGTRLSQIKYDTGENKKGVAGMLSKEREKVGKPGRTPLLTFLDFLKGFSDPATAAGDVHERVGFF